MKRAMQKTIILEHLQEYISASVARKTEILKHVCFTTDMQRKAAIRAFAREQKRSGWKAPAKLGRPRVYTTETEAALAWVWEQYEFPSAERLKNELREAIRIFARDGMWRYDESTTSQLLSMSLGAMKVRTTAMAKQRGLLRGASTTRSGPLLKSVPVFFGSWAQRGPGYGQVDTVVHSGEKLMGTMVYTVNYVDVATYWQELVAQFDKTAEATIQSLQTITRRLPWELKGLHPDSGSEFINELGIDWCKRHRIELTRSRPHKKNDNAFVEQRNLVAVRKYVGYERYDCVEAVAAMNELYETLRLYLNFFQPTFKLVGKERRPNGGYKRIYDTPKTPYQRVLERGEIDQATKDKLNAQYEALNPKILRDRIRVLTIRLERIQRAQGYHF